MGHSYFHNNTRYNEFPQDVHHQAKTRTQDEYEPTCATVGQDEDWKQDSIQCQEKTLEKNQTWTLKRSEKAALIWKSFWKSLVDSLHWLMFLNHEMDTSRIL